ncbi:MAG: type II toxin-antitoxin system ParD family antitoxin [Solirubrobacteraceae bacterium]|nr:type II toxin-antitoxin system ParD family antitoxin [Solirubrobacteraceae bacterium]
MATNTSISLDDHFAAFLADQVGAGRYRSASEVVRAGLRLLEEREIQLSALRSALAAGEASGEAEAFDFDAFVAAKTS